ncbi:MAG: response regulator [Nitrososphaeraceae archaeon]|jgi:DNA-binding response OmpR family regulator
MLSEEKMNDGLNNSISRSRILLVDDDVDITTSLKIGLEDNGFVVDTFNDPLLALSNFKPGIYDLLLFDIRMPQLSGFDLYDKIKKKKTITKIVRSVISLHMILIMRN